ncbi:MAG: hypothetical protein U0744_13090 [Gemmataceae bacterium]
MESLRLAPAGSVFPKIPCCRCADNVRSWDRIAGKTYCPHCLEELILGEAAPIVERPEKRRCSICRTNGTVRYLTFPLRSRRPVEVDLCSKHLRDLLSRRLGPQAFDRIRKQLSHVHIQTNDIFLLHEAFYDPQGQALQPTPEEI